MKIIKKIFLLLIASLFIFSCKSVEQNKVEQVTFDYDDEEIVKNEIERINDLLQKEPVCALWHSVLLGREDVKQRCINTLEEKIPELIENEEYFEARKYFISLTNVGWKSDKYTIEQFEKLCLSNVPGISSENKLAPKSISDCMEATVTVWLDRGIKIQNGSGYMDIVIGSGFFIDERGYIVTNYHVIDSMVDPKYEGYSRLYIKLLEDQDTKIPAKVIGYDKVLDLALLKTEIKPKVVLNLGSSSELHIGDKVSAIGTPIGLEGTLTSGIISSTERKLLTVGNVFQLDAAVNSGNSGGPMLNENLRVQGVIFAGMLQFQGLNFAIPVEYLSQELPSLYYNEEVVHTWIGAYGHTKRTGKKKTGLEIQYVLPGSPAGMAGFKDGDVIIEVEGKKISSMEDFQFVMMKYEPDTLLKCKYLDENNSQQENYLYLAKRPDNANVVAYNTDILANSFIPLFGMKMVNSSTINKKSYTIQKVIKGSTADELNISENDSITVKDVKFDKVNNYIYAQILAKRKQKGFLDVVLTVVTTYDNPYFF